MTWFLFEAFLLLERWQAKVVQSPLPGSGMAIQHLLHPADALAAVASCWCCRLVDISVLPPRQPGLFCQSVSGCRHLHPEKFLYDLRRSSRWDFSCPHPPASRWVIQIHPCRFSIGASRYPITPAATRRHCIGLAVDRLCTGRERLMHNAVLFAMLQAAASQR